MRWLTATRPVLLPSMGIYIVANVFVHMTAHKSLAVGRQQVESTTSIARQDAQEVVEEAVRKAPAALTADSSEPVQPSNAAALDVPVGATMEGDHASACTGQEDLMHNQSDVAQNALQLAGLQVTAPCSIKAFLWGAASQSKLPMLLTVQASLKRLDPLLAALAAVPWHEAGSQEEQRAAAFLKAQGVDELEGQGGCHLMMIKVCLCTTWTISCKMQAGTFAEVFTKSGRGPGMFTSSQATKTAEPPLL